MNNDKIKCICGNEFEEKFFKKHYRKCTLFINKFNKFDYKISILLEEYLFEIKNIFIIRYLMKRYLKLIDKRIIKYNNEINDYFNKPKNKEEKNNDISDSIRNNKKSDSPKKDIKIVNNILTESLNYVMKEEELIDCSNNFKDFINIDIFRKAPSDKNLNKKKSQDKIPNKKKASDTNEKLNMSFIPYENLESSSTPTPGFEKEGNNCNNTNDNYKNKSKEKAIDKSSSPNNSNNNDNNNDNNNENNNDKKLVDYFFEFGKNYIASFFTQNSSPYQ